MQIIYHGQSCFTIKSGNIAIVTDPYDESIGLNIPNLKADIVTVSHEHPDHNNIQAVKNNLDASVSPKVFDWPGEYECKGVVIKGISSFHNAKGEEDRGENTIFTFTVENIKICHLGDQGCKIPGPQLELIGNANILMIPVGGHFTVDAEKATEIVEQIEPNIIIPMHYKIEGVKADLDSIDKFLSEMGVKNLESKNKLDISKANLTPEKSEVILLEAITG